jgi:glycosyltransferase involved in cell wall biosynthesis
VRRVLFLAYHFPPIGGAGVQRSVKFVRYLPNFGYEPLVVTGPAAVGSRWTPVDDSLAGQIVDGAEIRRLETPAPQPSGRWRGRAERWLRFQEPFFRWWEEGAYEAGKDADVDLVYASMSPFETGTAAARLAIRLGKPWVADLRDPWALDEMQVYPSRWHRWLDLRAMRALLSTASAVVMNTEESARLVRAFPEFDRTPVFAVPNGYDAEDFATPLPRPTASVFRIVHTGYLHTELGRGLAAGRLARRLLGGDLSDVNILTRSHVYLLEAIGRLIADDASVAQRLELHLAGVLSGDDVEVAQRSPVVRMPGYLPHDETIALLRSADLLFLPMHDLPAGVRARIVPGKTYEYLASGRPILAAVPDGDARDLVARAATGLLCRPDDVDAMTRILAGELERARLGIAPPTLRTDVLEPYERRALTERLAGIFDAVLRERLTPGRSAHEVAGAKSG